VPGRKLLTKVGPPVAFLLPVAALIGVLRVWPLEEAVRLSFTNWDGFSPPRGVGFANYRELWHDEAFRQVLLNNLKILAALPLFVATPFLVAAALQSRIPGWSLYRAAFFFPTLISPAIIGLTFNVVLKSDGGLNTVLHDIGLDSLRRDWLVDPTWALIWVILVIAWALIGVGTVIFLAAMGTVDASLIDAAKIDGASWWRVQRSVVFWQILPVIELWTVLVLIATFTQFFPLILTLTNGGPGHDSGTADLYVYQEAYSNFRNGYASAASVVIFVITVVFLGAFMGLFRWMRTR